MFKKRKPNRVSADDALFNGSFQPGQAETASGSHDATSTVESRRDSPRVAYAVLQWVAPCADGTKMPAREEFQEVCCRDISAGGFSYMVEKIPKTKYVVISLGANSVLKGVLAEVIHVNPVEYDGEKMYAVGCRYTSQVVY